MIDIPHSGPDKTDGSYSFRSSFCLAVLEPLEEKKENVETFKRTAYVRKTMSYYFVTETRTKRISKMS